MFKINKSTFSDDGKTIVYNYEISREISKYFSKKESFFTTYDRDITDVPENIALIPLLANIMPIAWFVGFEVFVDELDATFYQSLIELKAEFAKHFQNIKIEGKLHANKLVQNTFSENNSALLFSGGLDSFESLTRNIDSDPFLVSVLGADIQISDNLRWKDFKDFNAQEQIINDQKMCYVTSNLRTFYTYEVDFLVGVGWWGKIQHGMALLGLIAPLSYLNGITTIYIASSNTGEVSFGWGSTSETDEKVKWANTKVIHDGFHLRRTEKIENIVNFAHKTGEHIQLRVCYSELRTGYNCNVCAKCQRTMLGFILCNENPELYGFKLPANFNELIMKNFGSDSLMTTGVAYEWKCLQEKARSSSKIFSRYDESTQQSFIKQFIALPIDQIIKKDEAKKIARNQLKYRIISRFPKLFNAYLKIRRKI